MFKKKDRTTPDRPTAVRAPAVKPPVSTAGPAKIAKAAPASAGKQAYEARRAAKAGMNVDKWMAEKDRRAKAERDAELLAQKKAVPPKPGLLRRLLDKAHRPI